MDDDDDEDDLGKEARRATVCIEAINQAVSIATTRASISFPGAKAIDRDEAFGDRRIKAGGALECRATGVIEKLGPLLTLAVYCFIAPEEGVTKFDVTCWQPVDCE